MCVAWMISGEKPMNCGTNKYNASEHLNIAIDKRDDCIDYSVGNRCRTVNNSSRTRPRIRF